MNPRGAAARRRSLGALLQLRSWPLRRLVLAWGLLVGLALAGLVQLRLASEAEDYAWKRAGHRVTTELSRLSLVAGRAIGSDRGLVAELLVHSVLFHREERRFLGSSWIRARDKTGILPRAQASWKFGPCRGRSSGSTRQKRPARTIGGGTGGNRQPGSSGPMG